MKLSTIVEQLELEVQGGAAVPDIDVKGGYVSDLLSDVLANARERDLWITLQIHPNIVAVAAMKGVAAIVMINGRAPTDETLRKAQDENLPILVSPLPAFELAGRLHQLGVTGLRE
jgi:hypothetical protein